ncbi:KAT8 regulatory NSL complex subunit 3 [Culicoides brevitarsis]|uniref:KAT8 regulatory NSL complex subunit 3 n=1 Tax=Culicoides brevitarsis TaxID=469753 RepID=UPI00307C670C
MEHSYSHPRDKTDSEATVGCNKTRTLMVHRPPQCPSCHTHSHDDIDLEDSHNANIPPYNEEAAKEQMDECFKISLQIKNNHSDEEPWEDRIVKYTWTPQQSKLFSKIVRLLDLDRLARLAIAGRSHEAIHRRTIVDKSVERLRKAFASVSWDTKLTQWVHSILLDNLPSSYLAIYMDTLQTLKAKVPSLTDRIIFGRPGNINQDLVGYILKKPWEPQVAYKNRKLPNSPYIVVVPSGPTMGPASGRMQQWLTLFTTMAAVVPVQVPVTGSMGKNQPLQSVTEQLLFTTRAKLQEIRQETPERPIILVGFNAGAALALQVGVVEPVNCIITLGFGYNTINGVRGTPEDNILSVQVPVLFIVGQNAARSSPEEIETLRERMSANTSMVVVGSADDALRVGKTKRKIEGVTQAMIDNMIMDEIQEFATASLENPTKVKPYPMGTPARVLDPSHTSPSKIGIQTSTPLSSGKKRKISEGDVPKKLGRPRLDRSDITSPPKKMPPSKNKLISLVQPTGKVLDDAIQSILPSQSDSSLNVLHIDSKKLSPIPSIKSDSGITKLEIKPANANAQKQLANSSITFTTTPTGKIPRQTFKVISGNQFIQLKPSPSTTATNEQKFITVKSQNAGTKTGGTSKIYTLKSGVSGTGQTFIETKPGMQSNFSPTKFTIMKQSAGNSSTTSDSSSTTLSADCSGTDFTNILDMPVVFADSDGNITPEVASPATTTTYKTIQKPTTITQPRTQYIIQTKSGTQSTTTSSPFQTQGKQFVISSIAGQKTVTKPGNMVILNKNPIKTMSTTTTTKTIGGPMTTIKYARIVTTTDGQKIVIPATSGSPSSSIIQSSSTSSSPISSGKKIEIINSSIIKPADPKYQPIIINVDNKGQQIKKVYRNVDGTTQSTVQLPIQTSMSQQGTAGTIVIQRPKTAILNRGNLTVKRVNVPPGTNVLTSTQTTHETVLTKKN